MTIPVGSRNCTHCLNDFPVFGNERVCSKCRKPKVRDVTRAALSGKALTSRQKQVAGMVGLAMLNKEIAGVLYLTEGTIKVYLNRIFRKVGVSNRVQLALWWVAHNP